MTNTNTNVKKNSIVSRCTLDSKSLLARLLAAENIVVEHVPDSETAYFDTSSRRLVLPVWKDMDEDTYDMLVGHEVAHALYTPAGIEPLMAAIDSIDAANPDLVKGYLNIVEDARIERLMKRRYPGLTHNFRRAYTRMYESDMFGFKRNSTDPAELGMIDRLNLRAKVGVHVDVDVPLDTLERLFFGEMMRTETFDQVVELTRRIYEHARKPKQQPQQPQPPRGTPVNVAPSNDDMMDDSEGAAPGSDEQPGDEQADMPDEPQGTAPGEQPGKQPGEAPDAPITNADRSKVAPRDRSVSDITYVEIGDRSMLRDVVVDHATIARDMERIVVHASAFDEFRRESQNYVNMLVKEFELRKAADMHARTMVGVSGVLDPDRLHQHRYVEDIFRRITTVKEGKNHGMVLMIDWSGSMSPVINNTIRQVMCLVWFCRACNIPFEVYAFSDNMGDTTPERYKQMQEANRNITIPGTNREIALNTHLRMLNWLSSRMTSREFTRAMQVFFTLGATNLSANHMPQQYSLNGTPLMAGIVAARHIVDEFRERNNLQVVNTVVLTDGDDTHALWTRDGVHMPRDYGVAVVRDRATRSQVMMGRDDNAKVRTGKLLQLLKFTTGSNVVGMYVISSGNGKTVLADVLNMKRHSPEFDAIVSKFRNDKYVETSSLGYDAYFVVPGAELDMRLDARHDYTQKDLTKGRIAGAFLKASKARAVNRVLLQRFIGFISR